MRHYRVAYRPQREGQNEYACVVHVDASTIWHAPFQVVRLTGCSMGDVYSVVEVSDEESAAARAERAAAERRDPGPLADGPFVKAREASPAAAKWAPKRGRKPR